MERVDQIFQKFDKDHDEVLTIEEIMPFFKKCLGLPQEHCETFFHDIDANGDNHISKPELYDFFLTHDGLVEKPSSEESESIPRAQPATLKEIAREFLKTGFGVSEPQ